ncbi:MAG TPA: ATP synthase F1 subunit gamma [Bacteroidales bacterium]|nr:ATP synthase F1 subunit gamma [Bacteroidales bacterium]HPF01583.1 ATP synthase F1 subunit gamma [Bacteroidales bacterium]HPJ59314.1 ATP synthase F1 subunit gamma [Bacteroidales bacterium]HPR13194.1 ATP synthase F1 subunit gamma [Bacteroidales bacterium]HRW83935.1 ATP synthase F1 subunit gamma [Bacteroidales bacterium]
MANLKAIRIRISSVKSTRQITSAMKMVSAAKLRKAQDKILRLRPYASKLSEILTGLTSSLAEAEIENVYARSESGEKILLIVVTSNRGLCGAFNSNVIKEARRLVSEKYEDQFRKGNLFFMAIGKKGYDYLRKQKLNLLPPRNELFNDLTFDNASVLAEEVMNSFLTGEFDRVEIIYNRFRNAAMQDLTSELFLPLATEPSGKTGSAPADYIYEPSGEMIIKELIPKSLKIQFYKAVLNSFVAEHGARMTAMHKATDNATEMIRDLTLQYNKARQAAITNQILEVVSGAEALKG